MRRRTFLAAGLFTLARGAAGQSGRARRLALLGIGTKDAFMGGDMLRVFNELGRLGYAVDRNLVVDEWYEVESPESLAFHARKMAAARPDAFLCEGSPPTLAAQAATRTIPIVTTVGDPVALGVAKTLQRPGGNVTGISQARTELARKQVDLLLMLRPDIRQVATAYEAPYPGADLLMRGFVEAARSAKLEVHSFTFQDGGGERLMEDLAKRQVPAVYMLGVSRRVATVAMRRRIALVAAGQQFVRNGALLSVEPDNSEDYLRIASILDKVLKGSPPGEIPFEVANRFFSTLNARTAESIGIRVTPEMRLRIDRVIE
jgi:putative ABC transport system substrate-binding protein